MPAFLTPDSTLQCPHGGMVTGTPSGTRATAGSPILCGTDSFVIAGCSFAPGGAPHPCVTVQWVQTGTRVKHGGALTLTEESVGLCLAGDQAPQGTVLVSATQPNAGGL